MLFFQLSQLPLPVENAKKGKCNQWTFRPDWHQAQNVTLDIVRPTDGKYFGSLSLFRDGQYCCHVLWIFREGASKHSWRDRWGHAASLCWEGDYCCDDCGCIRAGQHRHCVLVLWDLPQHGDQYWCLHLRVSCRLWELRSWVLFSDSQRIHWQRKGHRVLWWGSDQPHRYKAWQLLSLDGRGHVTVQFRPIPSILVIHQLILVFCWATPITLLEVSHLRLASPFPTRSGWFSISFSRHQFHSLKCPTFGRRLPNSSWTLRRTQSNTFLSKEKGGSSVEFVFFRQVHSHLLWRRLHFRKLHMIDWVQLNTEDVEQNDLWSMYLPPKVC